MFTGLVEEKGRLLSFTRAGGEGAGEGTANAAAPRGWHLTLAAQRVLSDAALGDSIAVNGCCLTVVAIDHEAHTLTFDVLEETRRLTNFAALSGSRRGDGAGAAGQGSAASACAEPPAQHLNLERSLRADARLGGHFVTGHVDGVGTVESLTQHGADYRLRVRLPGAAAQHASRPPLVHKGSIAIDGVSLTVAEVDADGLTVWLIPTTLAETNLGEKQPGDPVNLEYDLLGKYVAQILGASSAGAGAQPILTGASLLGSLSAEAVNAAQAEQADLAALDGA